LIQKGYFPRLPQSRWVAQFPPSKSSGKLSFTRFERMKEALTKMMSKSQLIQEIADKHPNNISRKDVKAVIESLATIGYKELKKSGAFLVPGFAKFVVIKKPATKERSGINPFTKEPTIFKAKPARKIVRARPVKAAKDAVA
jgi:DNA-binding protein HU-beta